MKKKDIIKALSAYVSEYDIGSLLDCSSYIHDCILDNGFNANRGNKKLLVESLATLSVISKALIEKLNISDEVKKEEESLIFDIISSIALDSAEDTYDDEVEDDSDFDGVEADSDFDEIEDDSDSDEIEDDSDEKEADSDSDEIEDDFEYDEDDINDDFYTADDSNIFGDNFLIDDFFKGKDDDDIFESNDCDKEDFSEYDTEECDFEDDDFEDNDTKPFGDNDTKPEEHKKDFSATEDFLKICRTFQERGNKG